MRSKYGVIIKAWDITYDLNWSLDAKFSLPLRRGIMVLNYRR
jgi:hypothetical protein